MLALHYNSHANTIRTQLEITETPTRHDNGCNMIRYNKSENGTHKWADHTQLHQIANLIHYSPLYTRQHQWTATTDSQTNTSAPFTTDDRQHKNYACIPWCTSSLCRIYITSQFFWGFGLDTMCSDFWWREETETTSKRSFRETNEYEWHNFILVKAWV